MNTNDTAELRYEKRLLTDFLRNHIEYNTTNDGEAIDNVLDQDLDIFQMALS